ncbi:MAG: hypothetical protein ACXABY_29595, partial [Candidatus Thorarchaeota archaeon]
MTRREQLMLKDHEWLVSLVTVEETFLWRRFNVFLVMNSLILSASMILLASEEPFLMEQRFTILFVISITAILLCAGWYKITTR